MRSPISTYSFESPESSSSEAGQVTHSELRRRCGEWKWLAGRLHNGRSRHSSGFFIPNPTSASWHVSDLSHSLCVSCPRVMTCCCWSCLPTNVTASVVVIQCSPAHTLKEEKLQCLACLQRGLWLLPDVSRVSIGRPGPTGFNEVVRQLLWW